PIVRVYRRGWRRRGDKAGIGSAREALRRAIAGRRTRRLWRWSHGGGAHRNAVVTGHSHRRGGGIDTPVCVAAAGSGSRSSGSEATILADAPRTSTTPEPVGRDCASADSTHRECRTCDLLVALNHYPSQARHAARSTSWSLWSHSRGLVACTECGYAAKLTPFRGTNVHSCPW